MTKSLDVRGAGPSAARFNRVAAACCALATFGVVAGCGRVPDSGPATTTAQATTILSPSPTADPTADWQAYHSTNGRFSLEHPVGWFVSPEGNAGGLVSVGMGVKHPLGPYDYVTDIGAGSWSVNQNIDTSCFLLKNVNQ